MTKICVLFTPADTSKLYNQHCPLPVWFGSEREAHHWLSTWPSSFPINWALYKDSVEVVAPQTKFNKKLVKQALSESEDSIFYAIFTLAMVYYQTLPYMLLQVAVRRLNSSEEFKLGVNVMVSSVLNRSLKALPDTVVSSHFVRVRKMFDNQSLACPKTLARIYSTKPSYKIPVQLPSYPQKGAAQMRDGSENNMYKFFDLMDELCVFVRSPEMFQTLLADYVKLTSSGEADW